MDAAFWSADRVTLAGSRMPAAIVSTYSPVAALRPQPVVRLRTLSTTTDDALLDRRRGVADGVLDAVLALLELDLGGPARIAGLNDVEVPAAPDIDGHRLVLATLRTGN